MQLASQWCLEHLPWTHLPRYAVGHVPKKQSQCLPGQQHSAGME